MEFDACYRMMSVWVLDPEVTTVESSTVLEHRQRSDKCYIYWSMVHVCWINYVNEYSSSVNAWLGFIDVQTWRTWVRTCVRETAWCSLLSRRVVHMSFPICGLSHLRTYCQQIRRDRCKRCHNSLLMMLLSVMHDVFSVYMYSPSVCMKSFNFYHHPIMILF